MSSACFSLGLARKERWELIKKKQTNKNEFYIEIGCRWRVIPLCRDSLSRLYRKKIREYCRSCHLRDRRRDNELAWRTTANDEVILDTNTTVFVLIP